MNKVKVNQKETELDILEKKIEEKQEIDRKEYYDNNIAMFNITREFINKKNLLLYGGLALNSVLPKNKRFYNEDEVPDYDFFSPAAIKHGKELANIYARKGYSHIELKPGLHSGTYKLYVNFISIADITNIPRQLYTRMKLISQEERDMILKNNPELDLHIAPIYFLKMALHLELSRPNGFIDRWTKVYNRMVLFYKTYPLLYHECSSSYKNVFVKESNPVYLELIKQLTEYLRLNIFPVFGSEVFKIYLRESGYNIPDHYILDKDMTAFDIISDDYDKTTKDISTFMSKFYEDKKSITIEKHSPLYNSEIIPSHFIIKHEGRAIITVYDSKACYAFKEIHGLKICTIDTCLSFMYGWLLSSRTYYNENKIKCMINILLNLQKKQYHKNKLFSPFELKCYGYQLQLEDLKKKKLYNKESFKIYKPKKFLSNKA